MQEFEADYVRLLLTKPPKNMIQTKSGMKKTVGILLDIRILLAIVKFQFATERSFRDHPFHIIRFEVVVELVDKPQGSPWFPCVLRLRIIEPFDEKLKILLRRY